MERYTKLWASKTNTPNSSQSSPINEEEGTCASACRAVVLPVVNSNARPPPPEEVGLSNLPADPAQRKKISQFKTAKVRDDVRRAYLQKGPFQPVNHSFPQTDISGALRRFNP